jgi:hypothetical protein
MTVASAVAVEIVEIAAVVAVEMIVATVTAGEIKAEADAAEAAAEAVANGMIRSVTIVAVHANPTEAVAEASVTAAVAEVSVVAVAVQMAGIQKLARAAVGKMTEEVVMIGAIVTTAEMPKVILRTKMVEIAVVAEVVAAADHVSTKARATVVTSKVADKAVIDYQVCELQPASPPL